MEVKCFSASYPRRARVLSSPVLIAKAFDPRTISTDQHPEHTPYQAIWDTGATNSVISSAVVTALGLQPIGVVDVCHGGGKDRRFQYIVNIGLPNKVAFTFVGS